MLKKLFFIPLVAILFTACGSSDSEIDKEEEKVIVEEEEKIIVEDSNIIKLVKSNSIICTDETTFTITPTDDPYVTITKNVINNEITIKIDANSNGSLAISNCSVKP